MISRRYLAAMAAASAACIAGLGASALAATIDLTPVVAADVRAVTSGNGTIEIPNGTTSWLQIKNASAAGTGNTRKGYLRYDFSAIDVSGIVSATLTLTTPGDPNGTGIPNTGSTGHAANSSSNLLLFGVNDVGSGNASFTGAQPSSHTVFGDDVAWTAGAGNSATDLSITGAGTTTLTNAMSNTKDDGSYIAAAAFNTARTTALGSQTLTSNAAGSYPAGSTIVFDDAALATFLAGDTNGIVTLLLSMSAVDANGSVYYFDTSGAVSGHVAPTLHLTLVPEPASLGAAGAGVLLLGSLRRRRCAGTA